MVELEEIEEVISKGKTMEEILEEIPWKEFEGIVAEIFSENNFNVKKNFRFKARRRYEIDILAGRENFLFAVDCKKWQGGRYKKSGLRKAACDQKKRVDAFKKFLKVNPIAGQMLRIRQNSKFYPILVTLVEEDILEVDGTVFVPISKLNTFLLEFEKYIE